MQPNIEVSRQFLANCFKVDVRSIKNFVDEGMPKVARGKFPLAECVWWYLERERQGARAGKGLNDLDLARQRKTVAEAQEAEHRVAKLLATVIDADVHEEVVGHVCDRLMPILQNLSSNYTLRLEELGIEAGRAESLLEAIAVDLTSALRAVAPQLEAEAAAIEEPTLEATPIPDAQSA